jgi:pimeloyl-ACP methyl ester carboxylesterase
MMTDDVQVIQRRVELTEGHDSLVDDLTLRRLPEASHWVQQDAPDAVNAALADWLVTRGLAARPPRPGGTAS